jgi:hypothetical protein
MHEAMDIRAHLWTKLGQQFFVHPILVFSNKNAYMKFGFNKIKSVYVIQAGWLEKLITKLESKSEYKLNHDDIIRVLQPEIYAN